MRKRLLLADEDASVRESMRRVLEGAGYEVMLAADVSEAARRSFSETDLLILDLNLTIQNDWKKFLDLREDSPVPLIVTSREAHQSEAAFRAGADALLEKPMEASVLLEVVQELLNRSNEDTLRRLSPAAPPVFTGAPDRPILRLSCAPEALRIGLAPASFCPEEANR
jgi:DNA-binding response OmpR family regulator